MSGPSRTAFLAACTVVIIGCGSDTEPSAKTNGNSRFPMLTNYGGHLLTPLRIVVVVAANDSLRDSLFAFAKAVPTSRWWPAVATPYGVSPTATAFTVIGPPMTPGTQLTGPDVVSYVTAAAIDSAGYVADGRTVYLVFLPAGVGFVGTTYAAFHAAFGPSDAYAVIGRFQGETMQSLTLDASHEIIESATDPEQEGWNLKSGTPPWTASPWGLDDNIKIEENADLCEGTRYLDGGFYYQRVFSNQAASLGGDPCVPAIPTPYFNVVTANGWYPTNTGDISIPITGWSAGTVPDWVILESPGRENASVLPTVTITCPDTVRINRANYCGLNNGKTATVYVVLPPGSVSQTFFTFHLHSYSVANGQLGGGPGEDDFHTWFFGVYVP
jgi:hypothetical protein